jgi:ribosomal protein S18 acetylase RimI-like enzyme
MQETISCRNATQDDMDFIYNSLFDMAIEEKIQNRFHMNLSELYNRLFGENKLAEVIIAEITNALVGLVVFSETNRNFTLFDRPGMYVHDLYVLPSYRSKGVASYLGKKLKKIATERNYGRIDWVVLNDNKLGQDFFGRVPNAIKVDYIQYMRINIPDNL